jgi:hypothetical protein
MQLQKGKRYVMRNGDVTNPLEFDTFASPIFTFSDRALVEAWRPDGTWGLMPGSPTDFDLVAEFEGHTGEETTCLVLDEVGEERKRQDAKWGTQNHGLPVWTMILAEEVGEAAREANDFYFSKDPSVSAEKGRNYRAELVQVAAVAVAMIESYDRNEAKGE